MKGFVINSRRLKSYLWLLIFIVIKRKLLTHHFKFGLRVSSSIFWIIQHFSISILRFVFKRSRLCIYLLLQYLSTLSWLLSYLFNANKTLKLIILISSICFRFSHSTVIFLRIVIISESLLEDWELLTDWFVIEWLKGEWGRWYKSLQFVTTKLISSSFPKR